MNATIPTRASTAATLAEWRLEQAKKRYNAVLQRIVSGDRSPHLVPECQAARLEVERAQRVLSQAVEAART